MTRQVGDIIFSDELLSRIRAAIRAADSNEAKIDGRTLHLPLPGSIMLYGMPVIWEPYGTKPWIETTVHTTKTYNV